MSTETGGRRVSLRGGGNGNVLGDSLKLCDSFGELIAFLREVEASWHSRLFDDEPLFADYVDQKKLN